MRWWLRLLLVGSLPVLLVPRSTSADTLDTIRERGSLIWGGDQEGGGPYVFPDQDDPETLRGFEVELATMIAEELGVHAEFQQGQWDQLPSLLDRGTIDIVLNGFERTPSRLERYLCSRPYYMYGLQLMARRDSGIGEWSDLTNNRHGRRKVGVLTGSAAETYLRDELGQAIEVVTYDGGTDALQHASTGTIDATLLDDCAALFYADRYPTLTFVGRPVGIGYYVALMRPADVRLHQEIDGAINRIMNDGRLESLYNRWDMSGRAQVLALRNPAGAAAAPHRSAVDVLRSNLVLLLKSAGMTILLATVSMPIAMALGLAVALGRMYGPWPLAKLFGVYVEVLRGTPLMLQLYAIFFLLPEIGVNVPALAAAIAGLAINYSAYEAEIYRAGLQAIPVGQTEAALALGMTRRQAVRYIVVPQALRLVIPPITNDFIALFKDTSVCSVVTIVELTKRYNVLAQSTGAILELAAVTSLLYLLMSYPLALFARWSERRLARES